MRIRSRGQSRHDGISTLVGRHLTEDLSLTCEDRARRPPSANEEEGSHEQPNHLTPLEVGLPSLQNYEKEMFLFKLPSVCYLVTPASTD